MADAPTTGAPMAPMTFTDTTDHAPAPFTAGLAVAFLDIMSTVREPVDGEPDWREEAEAEGPLAPEADGQMNDMERLIARTQARNLMGAAEGSLPPDGVILYRVLKSGLYPDLVRLLFRVEGEAWREVGWGNVAGALGNVCARWIGHGELLAATARAFA